MPKQASVEHSYIGPRQVRPLDASVAPKFFETADGYEDICASLGIGLDENTVLKMMDALDAVLQPTVTTGSVTTPVQFLQQWLPGFVNVITQARKIDELTGIQTAGSWEDQEIVQGVMELTGTSVPYGDYTNVPLSSWNTNFEVRDIVRFEEGLRVGNLEEARAARMNVSSSDSKRKSAALALEIQRNAVGFYGFNDGDGRTYGYLNDPGLPNYVNVASNGTTTHWSGKTFLQITADIRESVSALRIQSGDTIDPETTPMTIAIATAAIDYLSVTSDFGISVRDWMRTTYPKMRPVSAPQLSAANGGENVFYLYAETVNGDDSTDDGRVVTQVVPAKFMVLGVAKEAKAYVEDYSNATAGVLWKRPYAVVRRSGI